MATRFVIEKNGPRETTREGRNGRIYEGHVTTWDVVDTLHNELVSECRTKREATRALAAVLAREAAGVWVDGRGIEHRPCFTCGVDCTTHPDAANPLSFCGDCGHVTCPDHRVLDETERCVACAARHYAA